MSPSGAAGVKQQVMKIPQNKAAVPFGRSQPLVVIGVDHKQYLAINQQGQQLEAGKAAFAAQLSHCLWFGQARNRGRNFGVTKPEQRPSARGFQHRVGAAPPHICEAG